MIALQERVEIPAPLEAVWGHLKDPANAAACVPGATLKEQKGAGVYGGSIVVAFGPTRVAFQGEVTLSYDDSAHVCAITSRGRDQRGMSNATASGTVTLSPAESGTLLEAAGSFDLTGPFAAFARSSGQTVARAMLRDFAANLAASLAPSREVSGAPAPGPQFKDSLRAKDSLRGGRLVALIIRDWVRSLFARSDRNQTRTQGHDQ